MLLNVCKMKEKNEIRISTVDARNLGRDLIRAADEADDHKSIHPVQILDLNRSKNPYLMIWVSPHDHSESDLSFFRPEAPDPSEKPSETTTEPNGCSSECPLESMKSKVSEFFEFFRRKP